MNKHDLWQVIPYVLPVISYVIGKSKNKLQVPGNVRRLLDNRQVIDVVTRGIDTAQSMKDMTDEQKREYVRAWGKSELYGILGEWLPNSAMNYLIEYLIARKKGA